MRPNNFKGLRNVNYFRENDYYKYTYQQTEDINVAKNYLAEVKKAGFKDAFIIVFRDGKKITLNQAENIMK